MQHTIEVTRTARFFTYGELGASTKNIWFVCHGYGQLAEFFIKKFECLDSKKNFVVAPEALNRFYQAGFNGRVGATWMTREDRLNEIKDYVHYLNRVYEQLLNGHPHQAKINLLGFSQGGATVCRWAMNQKIEFDNLIIWAGDFPQDLDYNLATRVLQNKRVYFVYGMEDELIQRGHFEEHLKQVIEKGIQPEILTFQGKHDLDENLLLQLSDELLKKDTFFA